MAHMQKGKEIKKVWKRNYHLQAVAGTSRKSVDFVHFLKVVYNSANRTFQWLEAAVASAITCGTTCFDSGWCSASFIWIRLVCLTFATTASFKRFRCRWERRVGRGRGEFRYQITAMKRTMVIRWSEQRIYPIFSTFSLIMLAPDVRTFRHPPAMFCIFQRCIFNWSTQFGPQFRCSRSFEAFQRSLWQISRFNAKFALYFTSDSQNNLALHHRIAFNKLSVVYDPIPCGKLVRQYFEYWSPVTLHYTSRFHQKAHKMRQMRCGEGILGREGRDKKWFAGSWRIASWPGAWRDLETNTKPSRLHFARNLCALLSQKECLNIRWNKQCSSAPKTISGIFFCEVFN